MDKEEFLRESKKHKYIYGYMYGQPIPMSNGIYDTRIINVPISKIDILDDCFLYKWGWPGPDGNIFKYEDYGVFWAFSKEDIDEEAAIEKVKF